MQRVEAPLAAAAAATAHAHSKSLRLSLSLPAVAFQGYTFASHGSQPQAACLCMDGTRVVAQGAAASAQPALLEGGRARGSSGATPVPQLKPWRHEAALLKPAHRPA